MRYLKWYQIEDPTAILGTTNKPKESVIIYTLPLFNTILKISAQWLIQLNFRAENT